MKTTWIVMKDGNEIIRCKTKKMAALIAGEVGGYIHKYTVEG